MTRQSSRSDPSSRADCLIIGGGASGLAAACVAARRGLRVTILESRDRVGKKILATGNGRCNLMNAGEPRYCGQAAFALRALERCPQRKILDFFHGLGLNTVEEDGLVYPATLQAASVLEALRLPLEGNPKVTVLTGTQAAEIIPGGDGFCVRSREGGLFEARRVIAAAGGPAQPKLSGSDSLYPALIALGHALVPPRPSLTALVTEKSDVRGLKGLRLPAVCTLCDGQGLPADGAEGEVLFAEDGVSGVCVMQLSREAGRLLDAGDRPTLYLDFSPLLGLAPRRMLHTGPRPAGARREEVLRWLRSRERLLGREHALIGALPRLLRERLQGLSGPALAGMLCAFPLRVTGLRGWDHAQVAAGGIDTDGVDPDTMESRAVPGLYLTGELLNVDGDCGGHNLMFAWASGMLAGESIASSRGGRS